jgi:hypothetical protein
MVIVWKHDAPTDSASGVSSLTEHSPCIHEDTRGLRRGNVLKPVSAALEPT